MNILISNISSYKAIVIAKFIKKHYKNVKIIGIDDKKFVKYFNSKYLDKVFIKKNKINLMNLIKKYDINYFFPIKNEEMDTYLKKRASFGKTLNYFGSHDAFSQLGKKDELHRLGNKLGLKIPKIYDDINEAKPKYLIKPINKSSAKDISYIFNWKEHNLIKNKYKNKNGFLFQEFIEGQGVGYSVFSKNGEITTEYGHRRLAEFPVSGGSSVYRESYIDDRMRAIAEKLLRATNWSGFAMFEFKLTENNELYLIEVNPRIWGSINQGLQNGVNYFSSLLGEKIKKNNIHNTEIKTYLSPLIYFSFLLYIFKLDFSPIKKFFKNILINRADISPFDDFGGWLSLISRKIL